MAIFCPFCGKQGSEEWLYCLACGKPIPPPAAELENSERTNAGTWIQAGVPNKIPAQLSNTPDSTQAQAENWSAGPRPWLRWWARVIDTNLWVASLWLILAARGAEIDQSETKGLVFLSLALWVPVEAILLSTFGTTPGKWLLNIKLRFVDGKRLTFGQSISRSAHVWLKGWGLGIPIVNLVALVISYNELVSKDISSWDEKGGTQILHGQLSILRKFLLIALIALLLLIILLAALVSTSQI